MSIHQDSTSSENVSPSIAFTQTVESDENLKFWNYDSDNLLEPPLTKFNGKGADSRVNKGPTFSIGTEARLGEIQFWKDVRTSIPLVLADVLGVVVTITITNAFLRMNGFDATTGRLQTLGLVGFFLLVQHIHGLYPACGLGNSIEFRRILRTCLIVISSYLVGVLSLPSIGSGAVVGFLSFATILVLVIPAVRSLTRQLFCGQRWWSQPVLVIGSGVKAESLFHRLESAKLEGIRPVGIAYDPSSHWSGSESSENLYIGPSTDLESILLATKTCRVAIADQTNASQLSFSGYCGIPHIVLPAQWQHHPTEKVRISERNGQLELHCVQTINSTGAMFAKRFLDLTVIAIALPILIPLFILLGSIIKLTSKGRVFYSQNRIGKGGKEFKAWKFRSMVEDADAVLNIYLEKHPELKAEWERDHKLKNDPRITSIGRILRKTSLDELPQLWNVLIGEMSLVGPRPIVRAEVSKYGELFKVYKLVRPGITGLWQISGRNNTTYEERLYFDRFYVQNWSCMLDVFILWRTVKTALFQEGAY